MVDCKAARLEADRLVAQAISTGARTLSLSQLRIDRLPARIGELAPWLVELDLSGCHRLRDLGALAPLQALQSLDLTVCSQVSDLSALAPLQALQSLNLSGCSQVSDLSALARLQALQSLNLSGWSQVNDLSALVPLQALQSLNLSGCSELSDLSALASLQALQILDLSECSQVSDLSALALLPALQILDLSGCSQVSDLSAMALLPALQILDLSRCSQVSDLSALVPLQALKSLTLDGCVEVSDLSALASLQSLRNLTLDERAKVSDLSALVSLHALKELNLTGCTEVTNLSVLSALNYLAYLSTSDTSIDLRAPSFLFEGFARLGHLSASDFMGAPRELAAGAFSNCLPALEQWYSDLLQSGPSPVDELKVFVLGNGSAGKTQIVRRLRGEEFDPSVPSTHGVSVTRFELLPAVRDQAPLNAVAWDFGGQDIYLGTHRLFLDERAIFVLVWTPDTENECEVAEAGVSMHNHQLAYWLDYLREFVGTKAPVLVVQSQCDAVSLEREAPVPPGHGFAWLQRSACSAKEVDGLERLWPLLRAAARLQRERHGEVMLPQSWTAVGRTLRERAATVQVMPRDEFDAHCAVQGVSAPTAVLEYLHRSGAVFWRPQVFGGDVVLDQAWALDGIYAVMHRRDVLPVLRQQHGHFTRELLGALLWNGRYSEAEQEHFISLMLACRLCFKVADGHYVAPDWLPARAACLPMEQAVWRGAQSEVEARLSYAFLHEGMRTALLCAVGEEAGVHAVYWRHGTCFFDATARVVARIDCVPSPVDVGGHAGDVVVQVCGPGAAVYARALVQSVERELRTAQPPQVAWAGTQEGAGLGAAPHGRPSEEAKQEPEAPFANVRAAPRPAEPKGPLPKVYVSYAWCGESEALVNRLEATLQGHCEWRRDKTAMRTGDWISRFMAEIGASPCVVTVISAEYLRSEFCMRELLALYQTSQGDKASMLERIVPVVLPDAGIRELKHRHDHALYWRQRYEEIEASGARLSQLEQGDATRHELLAMADFKHHVVDMLTWVADVLKPRVGSGDEPDPVPAVAEWVKQRIGR